MARKGDVELVIRAKNEATKAVQSVAEELKNLVSAQTDVGKSAEKTDSLLGRLKSSLVQLDSEAKGLAALGKVARNLDQATEAVSRLEKQVGSTVAETKRLSDENGKAVANVERLTAATRASADALEKQRSATAQARQDYSATAKSYRDAESALTKLANQVDRLKEPNTKLVADWRAQREVVGSLRAQLTAAATAIETQKAALVAANTAYRDNQTSLRTAAGNQRQLQSAAEQSAVALDRQREALTKAQADLGTIQQVAQSAGSALGGVAANQDAVAAASKRAADEIAKVNQALSQQKGSDVRTSAVSATSPAAQATKAYRDQVGAVRQAQQAWRAAQADAAALAREVRGVEQPTAALSSAFMLSREAARDAKQAYLDQVVALQQLRSQSAAGQTVAALAKAQQDAAAAAVAASQGKWRPAFAELVNSIRRVQPAAQEAAAAVLNVGKTTEAAAGSMAAFGNASRTSMSFLQRLRGELLSTVTAYLGLFQAIHQIGAVVDTIRTIEAAESRLGAVFNQNAGKIADEMNFLRDNAVRLAIPFATLADEYTKFAIATKEAGFSQESVRKVFLSVAEAGRVNRLSVDQMQGVYLALTQMVSKGTVMSEELRRQLGDRLPGAFNLFAQALGVPTAKLDDMLKKGTVLANDNNLLKFADLLNQKFGPQLATSLDTVSAQLDRFKVRAGLAREQFANGGFAAALGDALKQLNNQFEGDGTKKFIEGISAAIGKVIGLLPLFTDNVGTLTTALEVFAALKVAQALINTFSAVGGLNRVMTEGRTATAGFRSALAVMQGTVTTLVGAMVNLRATVAATTVAWGEFSFATTAARAATAVFQGGLLALRGTMTAVAGVARIMWVAIGGVPGLILTGITLVLGELLGKWLTGVDSATAAMEAHNKILDAVQKGYQAAGGKVDQWAAKIKGVTRFEVLDQVVQQFQQMDDLLAKMQSPGQALPFGSLAGGAKQASDDIEAAVKAFKAGTISGEDFRKKISDIGEKGFFAGDFIKGLIDLSRQYESAKTRTEQYAAVLRVLDGTATDADKALLGLKDSAAAASDAFDSHKLDAYNAALEKMKKLVPELKRELARKDELDAAKANLDEAIRTATSPEQIDEAKKLYDQVVARIKARAAHDAASAFPINNDDIIKRIKFLEGNQNPLQRRPTSMDAQGIGQFMGKTWLDLFDQVFPKLADLSKDQKLALRFNEDAADKMLKALTLQNQGALLQSGVPVTPGNTQLAHFLGAGDAIKVILADAETPIKQLLSPEVIAKNPGWLNDTMKAGQVVAEAAKRMGAGNFITSNGALGSEKFNAEFDQRNKARVDEAAAGAKLLEIDRRDVEAKFAARRELEIAKAAAEEEKNAIAAGTVYTDEMRKKTAETVGHLFDVTHAQEKANALEAERKRTIEEAKKEIENVVGLEQQRETIIKEIGQARQAGDNDQIAELQVQLKDVTAQILAALPHARELALALGDEKAVAALDKIALRMKTITDGVITAKQVNDILLGNMTKGFDTAAQAIAAAIDGTKSWGDALADLGTAAKQVFAGILKDLAEVLLKQALLSGLRAAGSALGGSGSIGSFIASGINSLVAHTGAVVGGSGGWTRNVPVAAFSNAVRYHEGGIAGLKPGEVPAVLKRGEVVDPGDGSIFGKVFGGGQAQPQDVKIINAIDPSDFLSQGLNSRVGQRVIMNFIRSNKGGVKSALGIAGA